MAELWVPGGVVITDPGTTKQNATTTTTKDYTPPAVPQQPAPSSSSPAKTTPTTPKQTVTTPEDVTKQIQRLERQARDAEELLNNSSKVTADNYADIEKNRARLQKEAEDARSKAKILREWQEAGYEPPEELKALTSDKLAPFVTKDGDGFSIDVVGAKKAGVSDALLKKAGVKAIDIVQAKKYIQQEKHQRDVNVAVRKYNEADIKAFDATHTKLPDGQYMKNSDLEAMKKDSPAGYRLLMDKGYSAYESEYNKAKSSLDKYTEGDKTYLDRAIFNMDKSGIERLRLVYADKDINETTDFVKNAKKNFGTYLEMQEALKNPKKSYGQKFLTALQLEGQAGMVASDPYMLTEVERFLEKTRTQLKKNTASLHPVIGKPAEFVGRAALGSVIVAPTMNVGMMSAVTGTITAKNKAGYVKEMGKGMVDYFKDIPKEVKKDPAMAGELVGVFILSPEGAAKLAKWTKAKLSPFYVPGEGARFSFSTGKIQTKVGDIASLIKSGKITEADIARAITKAEDRFMRSSGKLKAEATIGKSNIKIHIEPTPTSKGLGPVLWHNTAESTPFKGKQFTVQAGKEPAMFTSLHSAPRFALQTSTGVAATSPAVLMIYTKKGGITYLPSSIQNTKSLAELKAKGFEYLGSGKAKEGAYGPIKDYGGKLENEAMFPVGEEFQRVKNLRSRILGLGAGEFVTTVDGHVLPIYRFAEKGAKVPKVGLPQLAAIRINSTLHSLRLMAERHKAGLLVTEAKAQKMQGKAGFRAQAGYARIGTLTKEMELAGKTASAGMKGAAAERAYRRGIDRAVNERLRLVLDKNPHLDRLYRKDPESFERAYREAVNRELARADGYRPGSVREAPGRPPVERERTKPPEATREPVHPGEREQPPRELSPRVPPQRPARGTEPRPPRVPAPPRPPRVPVPGKDRLPGRKLDTRDNNKKGWSKEDYASAAAFNMGIGIWAVKPGRSSKTDEWKFWRTEDAPEELRVTDQKTAYETIRLWHGDRPFKSTKDLGIVFADISRPTRKMGAAGGIGFRLDRRDAGRKVRTPKIGRGRSAGNGLTSTKHGRIFKTKVRGGTLLSRRPIGRVSRRR